MKKPIGSIVQLPDDAICINCTVHKFEPQFVYQSKSADFVGTEDEFFEAGKAEAYLQLDSFRRRYYRSGASSCTSAVRILEK